MTGGRENLRFSGNTAARDWLRPLASVNETLLMLGSPSLDFVRTGLSNMHRRCVFPFALPVLFLFIFYIITVAYFYFSFSHFISIFKMSVLFNLCDSINLSVSFQVQISIVLYCIIL